MTTHVASPEGALAQKLYSRIATAQDLDRIVTFINRAFADENPYLLTNRTDPEEIISLMQKGHFLLREEAGKLVGLIYGEIRGHSRGYLGLLVVEPTKRRDGIGKQLLVAGEDFCRQHGCRFVEGTVINRRPDLLERYKRRGFRVVGETPGDRSDHVQGGYSLILIEKDL
ncbi:GNAT family N-acetyltransferase [Tunturiibacter gelidoferens]|jgi:GNAT superfamily N-acetyltransferase|uniref:GNAT superfamily N-acetyltransferase n=1 Tax=Tunturiibacter gelidiferens TaxID=3069689 RepID=A0A9X0QJU3_9BACT|nr:GNAT family N-acetyltransferase [Edaphobacter lichenicola]MBB5331736.1 GNAT superfamily N-acetyltransferase [Edaphobacter lichenicola]